MRVMTRGREESGSLLIVSMIVVLVAIGLTGAALLPSLAKYRSMDTEYGVVQAEFLANTAISHAMDTLNQSDPYETAPASVGTYAAPISHGGGTYYALIIDNGDWTYQVTGVGMYRGLYRADTVTVTRIISSLFDYGLIGGEGQAGHVIEGNASIAGGLFVFGEKKDGTGDVTPTTPVVEFSGTGGVLDDWGRMDAALIAKVAPISSTYPLKTEVRVKNGQVNLSGTGRIGYSGNDIEGFYGGALGGTAGSGNLYSGNGSTTSYDVSDKFTFPDQDEKYLDPATNTLYSSYDKTGDATSYMAQKALNVDATLAPLGYSITWSTPAFSVGPDANGNKIVWDPGTKLLEIQGIIKVQQLTLGVKDEPITYKGRGTFWVNGGAAGTNNITLHADLLSQGTYPTVDVLGLAAVDNITVGSPGDAQMKFTCLMYAGGTWTSSFQSQIAGTVAANYFAMNQVPDIFAIPALKDNAPPGWIFNGKIPGKVQRMSWRQGLDDSKYKYDSANPGSVINK